MSMPDPNEPTDPEPTDPEPERRYRDVPAPATHRRDAPITHTDAATRTITARLVRYNDPHPVVDATPSGMHRYRETFAPESIQPTDRMHVVDVHDGNLVGHIAATRDEPDGFYGDLVVADTTHGRDLMALVDSGAIGHVSMEFAPATDGEVWSADRSEVTRTRSVLYGAAFAFRPAHDAPILAVRESMVMPDTPITTPPSGPPPEPTVTVTPATADVDALRRELVALGERVDRRGEGVGHLLGQYRSLDGWAEAAHGDRAVNALLARALVDQVTTDNPGVVPPGWLTQIMGIISRGSPAISALGGPTGLPDQGMDINWPYYDGDLTAIVKQQAAEKTAINSVKVSFKRGSEGLMTFAGGSDVSYQLIRRSSPSYREAYLRILSLAYAATADITYVTALTGVAGAQTVPYDFTVADPNGALLRAALFQASALVAAATGAPANAVLAATDAFVAIGGSAGLWPTPYGTTNAAGTATASTLRINVSGLDITLDPYLADGTIIVTNDLATRWYGEGPFTVQADDVEKLGQNIAVWGMGAPIVFLAAGLVYLAPVAPGRAARSSS